MANHKAAIKKVRADKVKRSRNRYQLKTTRAFVKALKAAKDKDEAQTLLKRASSLIDRLAKRNIIHNRKAANQKSKLTKAVNKL